MIDPFVLLAPVLMLVVIALVGFVGCEWVFQLERDPPKTPPNIHVIEGDGRVTLSWDPDILALTYELKRVAGEPGVVPAPNSYEPLDIIDRGDLPTIDGQLTYFDEENVTNGVTYHYVIRAINPDHKSDFSADIEATPHSLFGPFVTDFTPGTVRVGENSWFGIGITVVAPGITVQKLGRLYLTSNSGTHEMRIIDAATMQTLSATTVTPTSDLLNGFRYGNLTPGVPLTVNQSYFVLSREKAGGDDFLTQDTVLLATRPEAMATDVVESLTLAAFSVTPAPDRSFGPVNFQY
jgi:hypothetical protein